MNQETIKAFTNDKFGDIRVVLIGENQEPYFVGKDVAQALGYINTRDAVNTHIDEEDRRDGVAIYDSIGREQKATVINESGLYSLILSSKLSSAKEFKRWVTSEVLSSIRKHGAYMIESVLEQAIKNPEFAIGLLTKLSEEKEANKVLKLENAQQQQIIGELQPKATYYDLILQSKQIMPIKLIAKDYGMSPQEMNQILHKLGVQYHQSGVWLLYAKYHHKGYTQSKTQKITRKDGTPDSKLHTQWTQKGRLFIYELLKQNDILPMIERDNQKVG